MGRVSCKLNIKLPELSGTIEYKVHGSELSVRGKVIRVFRALAMEHSGYKLQKQ